MAIPVKNIIRMLLITELFLLLMNFFPLGWCSAVMPEYWCYFFNNLFELEQEANVPTWFSTLLLFSVSLTSFLIYKSDQKTKTDSPWSSFWLIFSIVFCFLSLDEASELHEMISSGFNFEWIWIYAPFGVMFFSLCAYFLENIYKKKELTDHILGGMIIFALGIIVSEIVDSYVNLGRFETVLEEGLEMLGAIIVLTGCLKELNSRLEGNGIKKI